jgi:hypothetical protein
MVSLDDMRKEVEPVLKELREEKTKKKKKRGWMSPKSKPE